VETRRDNLIYALCDAIMSSSWSDILANCGFILRTVFLSMFFIMRAWALSCSGSASAICDWAAFHSCSEKFIV